MKKGRQGTVAEDSSSILHSKLYYTKLYNENKRSRGVVDGIVCPLITHTHRTPHNATHTALAGVADVTDRLVSSIV
jgi:hypothetical protein